MSRGDSLDHELYIYDFMLSQAWDIIILYLSGWDES